MSHGEAEDAALAGRNRWDFGPTLNTGARATRKPTHSRVGLWYRPMVAGGTPREVQVAAVHYGMCISSALLDSGCSTRNQTMEVRVCPSVVFQTRSQPY